MEVSPQFRRDSVFDIGKEKQADEVLPILKEALASAGFVSMDRHLVYGWAEEISAGIRPQA